MRTEKSKARVTHSTFTLFVLAVAWTGSVAAVDIVTARDTAYQNSVSQLIEAREALRAAARLVESSRQEKPLANLEYKRLLGDLHAVDRELSDALDVHTGPAALRYQRIDPQSYYAIPNAGKALGPDSRKP